MLDWHRVDARDDHRGLLLGSGAGGNRVPDRLVVVVQGVRQFQTSPRVFGAFVVLASRRAWHSLTRVTGGARPRRTSGLAPHGSLGHLRMLTARASTTANVAMDTADSQAISIFAVRVNGMVSVGEKAMTLVIET